MEHRQSSLFKPVRIVSAIVFTLVILSVLVVPVFAQEGQEEMNANTHTSPSDSTDRIADDQTVKNVVLVHGAFADGSGWRGVYERLTARGYRVTIAQNPLTSLADDVAATQRVLDRQDGPTILVGHSWGGTVITEAGVHPNVVGLVYISALSPDAGETTAQQYEGFAATPDFVIDVGEDGYGFLNLDKFKAGFAHDVSDAEAAFMRDSQVPINMSVFGTPLQHAAWQTKPSWAVIATEDRAFDLAMLRHMANRIGATITEVPASHSVFMTQPDVVADTIHHAAQGALITVNPTTA